jgi:hypothetical protein
MNTISNPRVDSPKRASRVADHPVPGAWDATLSLYFLSWISAAPVVGFVLAETIFDLGAAGNWELWKAAAIGALLMIPFAVGAFFGLRAVAKGCLRGWIGMVGNVILGALAIGMPISEALTG